jgi:hypothetical protein
VLFKKRQQDFDELNESMRKSKLNKKRMNTLRVDYLRQSRYKLQSPSSNHNGTLEDSYKVYQKVFVKLLGKCSLVTKIR